jgi:hypothetical protein
MGPPLGSLYPLQHAAQQLRGRRQVPLRVRDMCVPQVRGKLRQTTLNIDSAAMPLEERMDGQPMTEPMQTRATRVPRSAQADLVRYLDERPSQRVIRHAGTAIGEKEAGTDTGDPESLRSAAPRVEWLGAPGHTLTCSYAASGVATSMLRRRQSRSGAQESALMAENGLLERDEGAR